MNKIVLLTGFSPFGGSNINPSYEACKMLDEKSINGYKIVAAEIKLEYMTIKPSIEKLLDQYQPMVAICTGQSGRAKISIERVAINIADSTMAYNCGYKPQDEPLEPDGPVGYFSTLPIKKILQNLKKNKIPVEISNSAGTFGCNQLFYHLMHHINQKGYNTLAGFIHVPSAPEQVVEKNLPSMCIELSAKASRIAIETTINEIEQMKSGNL